MSGKILVATDGSPLAERAVRYAVETFPDASVTTIHVIDPVDAVIAAEAGGLPEAEVWFDDARERAAAIHEAAEAIAAEYGVELDSATVVGRPGREILDYAEEHDIDQIVVGSHGRRGLDRAIFGSVAETVMRRGRRPVTVIR
ncbi:universal stress protein [Halogeometricum sp. S1BR25-6]|uniref:Universal stress protein n=1 Tax=Halogeometricum salsisoli TaxID=2950536 RepID=A0ABU2GH88_9EURY|nr:universal stress protein [Halogeometricum sp. S1BR25-6]MDS0300197.1 universal stress protein [Halogeometricum sp. S1BR25-6]